MLAVLVTDPLVAVIFATTVKVIWPPTGSVEMTIPPFCKSATEFPLTGQAAPPVTPVNGSQVTLMRLIPLTGGSVRIAPSAALGPAFAIFRVYVTDPLGSTLVG